MTLHSMKRSNTADCDRTRKVGIHDFWIEASSIYPGLFDFSFLKSAADVSSLKRRSI